MYLKSLVLKGFKSFVDKSVLEFEPGISVIVGPNGSGKSNISDAVLWVLGEMKPRNLRVNSLEELIFSGSSAREAVGVAEVDLVLDNSDGTLPVEFDEVVLTRRMFRNGESEYFINNSPCRRLDIIDVLYDSGIGQGAHSIISQGKLTHVLESSPQDRRALVEEAAGILKHKKRKEKAARKLAKMDASLERVNDIVKVIEQQLKPLERQAARARQHHDMSSELRELELAISVDDLRLLQDSWNEIERGEREIEAELELAGYRLEERENELTRRQKALEEKGFFAGDLNEQRIRCQSVIQRIDSGMLVLEEKGRNIVDRGAELRNNILVSERRLNELGSELVAARESCDETEARIEVLYADYREFTRTGEQINRDKKNAEEERNTIASSLRKYENALNDARNAYRKAKASLESFDTEEKLIMDHGARFEEELTVSNGLLSERHARFDALTGQLKQAENEVVLSTADIDKRSRLLDDRQRTLENCRAACNAVQAEIRALEEIDRAFAAASPSLSWILEHAEEFPGALAPISESLKVDSAYARLTERLLGSDLFGLFVEDAESANLIAERLRAQEGEGAISLMPLSVAAESQGVRGTHVQPSVPGFFLTSKVGCAPEHAAAAEALLGDVYVVDTIADAYRARALDTESLRFATTDGAIVWPNGKLTLGTQSNDTQGVLARKRRLEALADEGVRTTAAFDEAEQAVEAAKEALRLAQQDGFETSAALARLQGEYESLRNEIMRLEQSCAEMTRKRDETAKQLEDVAMRRNQTAPLVEEYRERMGTVEVEVERLKDALDAASATLLEHTQRKNAYNEEFTACRIELEGAKSSLSYRKNTLALLTNEEAELTRKIQAARESARALDVAFRRVDPLYELYRQLRESADVWALKLRDQVQLEQASSTSLRAVIVEATEARNEARSAYDEVQGRLNVLRIEKAKVEAQVEAAIAHIVRDNDTPLETAFAVPGIDDRAAAQERIKRLRKKLENMGAVNQVAVEEYEALKARRDYVLAQVHDLEEARKSLAKISAALDRKMRRCFLDTLEVVNRNYCEVFETLFPGGTGSLSLVNADDPENMGIEVNAQPRGKRITTLSLMSGGEQSLVALAFLIAIYRTRKVPFYIFDEVEAALDDTNLRTLTSYLSKMRGETQIIMVSHQRRTMEMADVLYGVSMQAAGVSKLVSQRLDQALEFADNA